MATRNTIIAQPFALAGDKNTIATVAQPDGTISMNQGWTADYQADPATVPTAKPIDRGTMNWLMNLITANLRQYQFEGVPEFIAAADNGGVDVPYLIGTSVLWRATSGDQWRVYMNTVNNNTAPPPAASWLDVTAIASGALQRAGGTMTGNLGLVLRPQFDNTANAASTAFVQRALGNLAGRANYPASATVPPTAAGTVIFVGASAGTTVTLPLANSVPAGAILVFECSSNRATLARQGGDLLQGVLGNLTSIDMLPDSSIIFESNNNTAWTAIGGSAQVGNSRYLASDTAANGSQQIGKTLVQRGTASIPGGTLAVTFPIAFPTACRQVLVAESGATSWSPSNFCVYGASPPTVSGFTARCLVWNGSVWAAGTGNFSYIAIGY